MIRFNVGFQTGLLRQTCIEKYGFTVYPRYFRVHESCFLLELWQHLIIYVQWGY